MVHSFPRQQCATSVSLPHPTSSSALVHSAGSSLALASHDQPKTGKKEATAVDLPASGIRTVLSKEQEQRAGDAGAALAGGGRDERSHHGSNQSRS